ncbi:MAG: amidase [Lachnospiraceae bacterium]|jgi:hypothetical protein|nr:amidase [Lachnospiraceae bacterium]MCX4315420.1 N-acetylmuramoyl-L-alanine amidase [Lachnospiraceae bacterium]
MSYTFHTLLAHPSNYGWKRKSTDIRYLVLHYTANKTDRAVNNAKYFQNNIVYASAHYFCDQSSVYQSVPDTSIAWSVGGKKYSDCATTGGGTCYGVVTNENSISIELCSHQGAIAAETIENALALAKRLMSKYHIKESHIYRHFDVTGKHCPGWKGWYGAEDRLWKSFQKNLRDCRLTTKLVCAFYKHDNIADGKFQSFPVGTFVYWGSDLGNGWSSVYYEGTLGYVKNSCLTKKGLSPYRTGKATEDVMFRSDRLVDPSTNIKTIKKGTTFRVICQIGNWYQVRLSDGANGYMVKKKVKLGS